MEQPLVHIRPARSDDLADVRDLLVETWHDTYDALLGAETVTRITDEWHSVESLLRQLDLPNTCFLVAEEKSRIVGHVFANGQHLPVLVLARLYVRPYCQRRGIGKALLDAAAALPRGPVDPAGGRGRQSQRHRLLSPQRIPAGRREF